MPLAYRSCELRAGVALIQAARTQGVNVSCETCPHYLVLTEDDVLRLGAVAKCAPPLRSKPEQEGLWRYLQDAQITTIGSDHWLELRNELEKIAHAVIEIENPKKDSAVLETVHS